jgi:hypothetical protein
MPKWQETFGLIRISVSATAMPHRRIKIRPNVSLLYSHDEHRRFPAGEIGRAAENQGSDILYVQ